MTQLVRALFAARHDIEAILRALASCLTASLCDGCVITLAPGPITLAPVTCHGADPCDELPATFTLVADPVVHVFSSADEAHAILPAEYAAYIARVGLRGVAFLPLASSELAGTVIATRDRGSQPFHADDLAEIATYIEYASLAAQSALQVELERSELRAERERTARFHAEMIGIVGHDLHAPLGAIRMSTEILATGSSHDTSATHAARRIVSFTKRMTRMVDQLLDLTRTRLGGGIPLARSPTRLAPLVSTVIEELTLANPGCHFELEAAATIRGVWDADRLVQALFNVLSNAVQFGLEGAQITVRMVDADDTTTITVHNELRGHPIAPAALATLFEPYHRGWDRDHVGTGLGLGLYIAHEIIRAHGGTIAVESLPSGTTCHVSIPNTIPA